jgi:citrate synthase
MPDSLTIIDNRTGRTYEVAIENGAIRATAFEQISTKGHPALPRRA